MSKYTKISLLALGVFLAAVLVLPSFRQLLTRLTTTSETIIVPADSANADNGAAGVGQELEIVTLLGFDGIPAILEPTFVPASAAEAWMEPNEPVLGLSIEGEHRAYSVRMLSSHEIVNDVVGGVPVAVTW
jgi:hypothetical protein